MFLLNMPREGLNANTANKPTIRSQDRVINKELQLKYPYNENLINSTAYVNGLAAQMRYKK